MLVNKGGSSLLRGSSSCFLMMFLLLLPSATNAQTIVDIISRELRFSTLVTLLTAGRLTDTLNSDGPFTLFAPTNQAFIVSRVDASRLLQPEWSVHLNDLLTYHVTLQRLATGDMQEGDEIQSANSGVEVITVTTAEFESEGNLIELNNNSTIIQENRFATNGLVHVVDHVLLPISASQTIYQFALANPEYSVLAQLIEAADLVAELNAPGPLTIFAPTNEAFASMQGRGWNNFINDQDRVRNLLLYHLVDGNIFSDELRLADNIQSLQGSNIDITVVEVLDGGDFGPDEFQLFLNVDSQIIITDDLVKNGIFHTIDRALVPPVAVDPTVAELLDVQSLNIFEDAARQTGLWDILNNPAETLTAFAAVDTGFEPEFTTILSNPQYYLHLRDAMNYQVVTNQALWSGELTPNLVMPTMLEEEPLTVTQGHPARPIIINFDSLIQIPDLIASNGALQIIDQVAVPPFLQLGIIDVIARQPFVHSTLVYLLVLTGLIPDLSSAGPYTIFAPTNAAFEQMLFNAGLLVGTDWTSNIDTMREILRYHVVPSVLYEEELIHDSTHRTLQGDTILVTNTAFEPLVPQPFIPDSEKPPPADDSTTTGNNIIQDENGNEFVAPGGRHRRRRRRLPVSEYIPPPPENEILLDGRGRILGPDQFAFNGVVHSIDTVLIPTWNDYQPQAAPESADVNQYCVQWGQFDEVCCPLDSETSVTKQEDTTAAWYCEYIIVP